MIFVDFFFSFACGLNFLPHFSFLFCEKHKIFFTSFLLHEIKKLAFKKKGQKVEESRI